MACVHCRWVPYYCSDNDHNQKILLFATLVHQVPGEEKETWPKKNTETNYILLDSIFIYLSIYLYIYLTLKKRQCIFLILFLFNLISNINRRVVLVVLVLVNNTYYCSNLCYCRTLHFCLFLLLWIITLLFTWCDCVIVLLFLFLLHALFTVLIVLLCFVFVPPNSLHNRRNERGGLHLIVLQILSFYCFLYIIIIVLLSLLLLLLLLCTVHCVMSPTPLPSVAQAPRLEEEWILYDTTLTTNARSHKREQR